MSESLHDIAMKLGLLNDVGSFKQGEKLMKDFADAALAQQRRVKEAATDLSGTDKYLKDPNKNILKKSQIEQLKQESLFSLDDKLANGTLSRTEYNKALQETVNRWTEITQAQQANLVILQHQQALQSINTEHIEDEIQRQKQLLELKQDINSRTQQSIKKEGELANIASLKQKQNTDTLISERNDDKTSREQELAKLKQDILNRDRQRIIAEREITEELEKQLLIKQKQLELVSSLVNKAAQERDIALSKIAKQESQDKTFIGGLAEQYDSSILSKSSTADKLAALKSDEAKEIEEIRKAAERSNISLEQMGKAIGVVQVKYAGMRNELDGTNAELREHESLVKRTHALLGTYSNMADRVKEDIETLTLALQKEIITQEQFNAASATAEQRLHTLKTGSGNLVYAIGEMGRGLEDFVTVMSITGFTTQGFGMAMRGASNNISQATMLMSTAEYAWVASAMGIGAIAVGQLIPYLFRTSKAVDEVTLAFERNSKAIDYTANAMSRMLDTKFRLEDISRMDSSGEARNIFTNTSPRDIERTRADLAKLSQERIAAEIKSVDSMLGVNNAKALNESVGLLKQGGFDEASVRLREGITTLRQALASGNADLINIAVKDLEHLRQVYNEAFSLVGGAGSDLLNTKSMGGMKDGRSDLESTINKTLSDKEKMNDIQKEVTENTNKELAAKQHIVDLEKQALAAKEKYFQLLEKEETIKDNATTRDARILEQESQFRLHKQLDKDIRGNISEESYLKDLSIRYRDMMSVDWMTEGSKEALDNAFRNDLFTREDELERSLFQQQPDLAVGTSTISEAMTNASKQMMDAQNDDKFTQQLNELKAIKKALEGNLFPVERIQ